MHEPACVVLSARQQDLLPEAIQIPANPPHVPPDFPTQKAPSIPIRANTTELLLHIAQLFKTLSPFLIPIVFRMKGFLSHRWLRFGMYPQVLT